MLLYSYLSKTIIYLICFESKTLETGNSLVFEN